MAGCGDASAEQNGGPAPAHAASVALLAAIADMFVAAGTQPNPRADE